MGYDVRELAENAGELLHRLGYSDKTIRSYRTSWNKVIAFCDASDIADYGPDAESAFFESEGIGPIPGLTPYQRGRVRHVRCLLTATEGKLPAAWRKPGPEVPAGVYSAYSSYLDDLRQRGLAAVTIQNVEFIIRHFLAWVALDSTEDIKEDHIVSYIQSRKGDAPQTKAGYLYAIRAFLKYLASKGMCERGVTESMPVIPGHKHDRLPSAYSGEEIAALLAKEVTNESSRRDYAMLLCASLMGMRASDIRNLLIDDIDWRKDELSFIQSKTGARVRLPLPDEVKLALADYLGHERPQSEDPHVFLHARTPYCSFDGCRNSFHYVASTAFCKAGIDCQNRHHGMHALRHSAATNLLCADTPYPVISSILGHGNANTTRRYLAIDVERLRTMSLEVPHD